MQRGILWGGYCSNRKRLEEGMQILLCVGKVSGFYKLLLHLFLLCLKLLVLSRTDLPGQPHNIDTAAFSGNVVCKSSLRPAYLPLRSSQVQRGRRILCSSGLKMCVLCLLLLPLLD